MPDAVNSALKALRSKRHELQDELGRVEQAINALAALAPGEPTPGGNGGATRSAAEPPARPSVRTMLVSLLDEENRDWSAAEVLAEYERRGTPVHGASPDNALRAAMVDASKAGQIERVATGRYRSTKFRPLNGAEREPLPYNPREVHRT